MSKFLEAFAYFLSNGLDFKLAKELAESVTGTKVTDEKTLEAFVPEIKKSAGKSQKFQMPEAKKDVIAASDEVSPSYAKGDTKYNADILVVRNVKSPRVFFVASFLGVSTFTPGLFNLFKSVKNL